MHWEEPSRHPDLGEGEVHVWRAVLDLSPPALETARAILPPSELRRADRYRYPVHGERFIATRRILRTVLAGYLGISPGSVAFEIDRFGKPRLTTGGFDFNLTHSGDRLLLAVARGRPVGIDVERMRRSLPIERLARRFFTRREAAELAAFSDLARPAAFYACWTRKEAYLKATGSGLERGLPAGLRTAGVPVSRPLSSPVPLLLRSTTGQWSLIDLDVASGYAGALAMRGFERPRLFEWIG